MRWSGELLVYPAFSITNDKSILSLLNLWIKFHLLVHLNNWFVNKHSNIYVCIYMNIYMNIYVLYSYNIVKVRKPVYDSVWFKLKNIKKLNLYAIFFVNEPNLNISATSVSFFSCTDARLTELESWCLLGNFLFFFCLLGNFLFFFSYVFSSCKLFHSSNSLFCFPNFSPLPATNYGMFYAIQCVIKYSCGDWDNLCHHLINVPWEDIFKLSASATASEFCEWIQVRIDVYIPNQRYHIKPHTSPWFSAACTVAIVHRNCLFCFYQQNKSSQSEVKFRQGSNHCKSVLEAAKLPCANKRVYHFPETWLSGLLANW